MGASKTELFTAEQNRLADICKAMGHPARVAILQRLIAADACIGKELIAGTGLSQPTVSRHIQALVRAGLVCGTSSGTSVRYCINPAGWEEVRAWFKCC